MIHPRFAHQTHLNDFLGHLQLACLFQDFFKRYPGFYFFDMCGFFFTKQMVGDQNDGSALCTKLVQRIKLKGEIWEIPPSSNNSNSELCPPRVKVSSHPTSVAFTKQSTSVTAWLETVVPLPSHDGGFGKARRIGENGATFWQMLRKFFDEAKGRKNIH